MQITTDEARRNSIDIDDKTASEPVLQYFVYCNTFEIKTVDSFITG